MRKRELKRRELRPVVTRYRALWLLTLHESPASRDSTRTSIDCRRLGWIEYLNQSAQHFECLTGHGLAIVTALKAQRVTVENLLSCDKWVPLNAHDLTNNFSSSTEVSANGQEARN